MDYICKHLISAACTRGMVRLMGGATLAEGTVAACFNNQWGRVCNNYWTDADAKVVCGQLGYIGKDYIWCCFKSVNFHVIFRW